MPKTVLSIKNRDFYLNGKLTYSEIKNSNTNARGLLMNARFIQGVFDDKTGRERYNRFGKVFDPELNTDELIRCLPQWYKYGLRAFTVGLQGGGPCFTIDNKTIDNNPFSEDGRKIDEKYLRRMDKLIRAADEIGMIVIVSFFYPGQLTRMKDGRSIANAVSTASSFLKEGGYANVIIEICNEMDVDKLHPIIHEPEGMGVLIDIAKRSCKDIPVGSSCGGGKHFPEVTDASDVVLIHGNGCSRQKLYNLICSVKRQVPSKPILCNEDSQALGQLKTSFDSHVSWGYYNNMTKQEPPVTWDITKGEDMFFAYRMAESIGLEVPRIDVEDRYFLQGLESDMEYEGKRWLRLAALYPENIDNVEFYRNNEHIYTCYDEPFSLYFHSNWKQNPVIVNRGEKYRAVIRLRNGEVIEKTGGVV